MYTHFPFFLSLSFTFTRLHICSGSSLALISSRGFIDIRTLTHTYTISIRSYVVLLLLRLNCRPLENGFASITQLFFPISSDRNRKCFSFRIMFHDSLRLCFTFFTARRMRDFCLCLWMESFECAPTH